MYNALENDETVHFWGGKKLYGALEFPESCKF